MLKQRRQLGVGVEARSLNRFADNEPMQCLCLDRPVVNQCRSAEMFVKSGTKSDVAGHETPFQSDALQSKAQKIRKGTQTAKCGHSLYSIPMTAERMNRSYNSCQFRAPATQIGEVYALSW